MPSSRGAAQRRTRDPGAALGISGFRVRTGACHRADLRSDPLGAPRNDGVVRTNCFGHVRPPRIVCLNWPLETMVALILGVNERRFIRISALCCLNRRDLSGARHTHSVRARESGHPERNRSRFHFGPGSPLSRGRTESIACRARLSGITGTSLQPGRAEPVIGPRFARTRWRGPGCPVMTTERTSPAMTVEGSAPAR